MVRATVVAIRVDQQGPTRILAALFHLTKCLPASTNRFKSVECNRGPTLRGTCVTLMIFIARNIGAVCRRKNIRNKLPTAWN